MDIALEEQIKLDKGGNKSYKIWKEESKNRPCLKLILNTIQENQLKTTTNNSVRLQK